MYALWLLGKPLERYIGSARFLAIYTISGISGSAGALLLTNAYVPTVGASGAIFGLMGALLVLERRGMPLVGPLLPILADQPGLHVRRRRHLDRRPHRRA